MKIMFAVAALLLPATAFAQPVTDFTPASSSINLTGIATSLIAGVFAVLGIVIPLLINARIKDAQAASTLGNAVKNSLGAIEQAATVGVSTLKPTITIPGVSPSVASGVQYVLDHAGTEAARLNITPAAIADKVNAQLGLAKIAATVAAGTAVPVTAVAPRPPIPIVPPIPPAPVERVLLRSPPT